MRTPSPIGYLGGGDGGRENAAEETHQETSAWPGGRLGALKPGSDKHDVSLETKDGPEDLLWDHANASLRASL